MITLIHFDSFWWCKCESYTVINNGGGTDDDVDENDYSED